MRFKMSSAIRFNLDQSEILLSGKGLRDKTLKNSQIVCSSGSKVKFIKT